MFCSSVVKDRFHLDAEDSEKLEGCAPVHRDNFISAVLSAGRERENKNQNRSDGQEEEKWSGQAKEKRQRGHRVGKRAADGNSSLLTERHHITNKFNLISSKLQQIHLEMERERKWAAREGFYRHRRREPCINLLYPGSAPCRTGETVMTRNSDGEVSKRGICLAGRPREKEMKESGATLSAWPSLWSRPRIRKQLGCMCWARGDLQCDYRRRRCHSQHRVIVKVHRGRPHVWALPKSGLKRKMKAFSCCQVTSPWLYMHVKSALLLTDYLAM